MGRTAPGIVLIHSFAYGSILVTLSFEQCALCIEALLAAWENCEVQAVAQKADLVVCSELSFGDTAGIECPVPERVVVAVTHLDGNVPGEVQYRVSVAAES